MADPLSPPGMPRWVKAFALLTVALALLVAVVMFTGIGGPHGTGRHMPSGDAGGNASTEGQP
jgi:hypothetical protein